MEQAEQGYANRTLHLYVSKTRNILSLQVVVVKSNTFGNHPDIHAHPFHFALAHISLFH